MPMPMDITWDVPNGTRGWNVRRHANSPTNSISSIRWSADFANNIVWGVIRSYPVSPDQLLAGVEEGKAAGGKGNSGAGNEGSSSNFPGGYGNQGPGERSYLEYSRSSVTTGRILAKKGGESGEAVSWSTWASGNLMIAKIARWVKRKVTPSPYQKEEDQIWRLLREARIEGDREIRKSNARRRNLIEAALTGQLPPDRTRL